MENVFLNLSKLCNCLHFCIHIIIFGRKIIDFIAIFYYIGKTITYAIPIIHNLQAKTTHVKRIDGPYAIVIVPTREVSGKYLNL